MQDNTVTPFRAGDGGSTTALCDLCETDRVGVTTDDGMDLCASCRLIWDARRSGIARGLLAQLDSVITTLLQDGNLDFTENMLRDAIDYRLKHGEGVLDYEWTTDGWMESWHPGREANLERRRELESAEARRQDGGSR